MMVNCKHYFGRVVKSLEGIPYDYQWGCMENHPLDKCGEECPFKDSKHDDIEFYTVSASSEAEPFILNNRHERRKQESINKKRSSKT